MIDITQKIERIPRFSAKYVSALNKLGIKTVEDFLLHFPFRYEDYSDRVMIGDLQAGENVTIMGEVIQSKLTRTWKKKMFIVECQIADESGSIKSVWFNQPYVSDSLTKGKGVRISGKVSEDKNGLFFSSPAWELSSRTPTNTGRLVPIYPETEGLSSKWIRWQMQALIVHADNFQDPIPKNILDELHLPSIKDAIKFIHFPKNILEFELAQKRFAFQQMLMIQIASQQTRLSWEKQSAVTIFFDEKLIKKFVSSLPFSLTNAQRKSAFQIFKDLEKPLPMNRLLNGDVGSGKTIVAALASLGTINAGFQVAIMAPTEVLAKQHHESITKLFKPLGLTAGLLTNSYQEISNFNFKLSNLKSKPNTKKTKFKKTDLLDELKKGSIDILIGTHALIQEKIKFKNLALIIIDEQHRFGVNQRAYMQQKIESINDGLTGKIPHLLTMTATPIPRTLALSFFGNLNLSILDEMPKNRKPIITEVVRARGRKEVYEKIRNEIKTGRQAFIIFPLVEQSKILTELKAATEEHKRLSEEIFPDLKLALLHGKMKSNEKELVMQDFKDKKYNILVATSVVEVGIDIPNASTIIIEDADRFGLSQLHQFRGRVGRGEHQSYCFLFTSNSSIKSKDRLSALEKNSSGFDIAQKDFELRGPGEFLGTRQSGLPDIAMEHMSNVKLIEIAHEYAQEILSQSPTLKDYPLIQKELSKIQQNVHLE